MERFNFLIVSKTFRRLRSRRSLWASVWIQIKSSGGWPTAKLFRRGGIVMKGRHSRRRGSMAIVGQKQRRSCGRSSHPSQQAGDRYWFWGGLLGWSFAYSLARSLFAFFGVLSNGSWRRRRRHKKVLLPPRFISSFNSLEKLKNGSRVLEMK